MLLTCEGAMQEQKVLRFKLQTLRKSSTIAVWHSNSPAKAVSLDFTLNVAPGCRLGRPPL